MSLKFLESLMTPILHTNMKIISIGETQPVICPVCQFVLRDKEDVKSVKKETACTTCVINFKYIYSLKWKEGWRPSIDEARNKMYI